MNTKRIALLVVLAGALAGCGSGDSTGDSSGGGASLTVIHNRSFCEVDAATAHITFVVAVKNTGTAKSHTGFRPWRRYNDGSVNSGFGDTTVAFDIYAHTTHVVNTTVPFDPTDHIPLACRVYFDDDGAADYYSIPVV